MGQEQQLLIREEVNKELEVMLAHGLTVLAAPMGYGKTTAVRSFLRARKVDNVWVGLVAGDGTASYFWDRLSVQISGYDKQLGETLRGLGFPVDAPQRTKILDILCGIEFDMPFVVVLDDFHLITDAEAFNFIKMIIRLEIDNLHIAIITRDAGIVRQIHELTIFCASIPCDILKFKPDESRRYFKMMGVDTDARDIDAITEHTDGWIAMIYLVMLGIKRGASLRSMEMSLHNTESLNELVEHNLYAPCDKETKSILCRLSLMDTFTEKQAAYVLGLDDIYDVLYRMRTRNALIAYDENEGIYKIHNVLLDFLRERAALPETERRAIYLRTAEWYMAQKEYAEAFAAYRNAGEPEAVMSILNDADRPFIPHAMQITAFDIFEVGTFEAWIKYPLAFIDYASNLILSGNPKLAAKGNDILTGLSDYFQDNDSVHKNYRDSILAEIHVCRIFLAFNNADTMIYHMNEASRLLQGGYSALVRRKDEFTFGCPHFLYIYHRDTGKLAETVDKMVAHFGRYADLTDGCGAGCDSLTLGEYALETFDLDTAEINALRAVYKANAKEQVSVAACVSFLLIRLNLCRGKSKDAYEILGQLAVDIEKENNPILNTTLDLITGYFYGLLGIEEKIPGWLRTGDMSEASFMYQGIAWNYVVYEKALLLQKEYIKLDALCGEHSPAFDIFQNRLGHLHNHIHHAAAKVHTQGMENAAEELIKALIIGQNDNIVLPFAENWRHVMPILEVIKSAGKNIDTAYLCRVMDACMLYQSNNPGVKSPDILLTERETEVLHYIADGLSRADIAKKMIVSLSTINRHVENLYRKLNVSNKTAALKKAAEKELL